jgi:hypothetical protein
LGFSMIDSSTFKVLDHSRRDECSRSTKIVGSVAIGSRDEAGPLFVYIHSKDFSPGSTLEARDFRGRCSEFIVLGG